MVNPLLHVYLPIGSYFSIAKSWLRRKGKVGTVRLSPCCTLFLFVGLAILTQSLPWCHTLKNWYLSCRVCSKVKDAHWLLLSCSPFVVSSICTSSTIVSQRNYSQVKSTDSVGWGLKPSLRISTESFTFLRNPLLPPTSGFSVLAYSLRERQE